MKRSIQWLVTLVIVLATACQINAQTMEKTTPEAIMNELKQCGAFFLATVDGDQPRVRPFGALAVFEGRLYLQTGKVKNVYRQLAANGKFELCGMKPNGTEWIRVSGTLINDDRIQAKQHMLDQNPGLKKMYAADDDNTAVLYIDGGIATFSSFTSQPRTVTF